MVVPDLLVSLEGRVRIAELVLAKRDVLPSPDSPLGTWEIFLHLAEKLKGAGIVARFISRDALLKKRRSGLGRVFSGG